MPNYCCPRCGYNTNHRHRFKTHLHRINICSPKLSDVSLEYIHSHYGIEIEPAPKRFQNGSKTAPNGSKTAPKISNIESAVNNQLHKTYIKPKPVCEYCNKEFSRNSNLNKHYKRCKIKKHILNTEDVIEKQNIKTSDFKNTQPHIINNTTINNTIHNTTINNIVIHNYGDENLSYLTNDDLTKFVKNLPPGIMKLIETIHFNPDHPENTNLRITNRKEPFIQIRKKNKWFLENKNEIINNLLSDKYSILEEHLNHISPEITLDDQKIIDRFRINYEENNVKSMLKNIELLIINNSSL